MSYARYLPETEIEVAFWLNNFEKEMNETYGEVFDFTPERLASIRNDAVAFRNVVNTYQRLKNATTSLRVFMKTLASSPIQSPTGPLPELPEPIHIPTGVVAGITQRIGLYVHEIKRHPRYTQAAGHALGIIARKKEFDPSVAKPVLSVQVKDGFAVLKWRQSGSEGAFIYVDRRDGNGFVKLLKTVRTEWTDTTPFAEGAVKATWDYKIIYMIADEEIGDFSDPVAVNLVRV